MIQLDKQVTAILDDKGEITGWNTQAVLLPNHFFLNPNITFDWASNTCTLDGSTYYLDKSVMKTSDTPSIPSESEWKNIYGNRIEYQYYDFVDNTNNPSGNAENVYRALYIDSLGHTKYIFQYCWDLADNCTSIQSLAPEGAEAQQEKIYVILSRWSQGKHLIPDTKCLIGEDVRIKKLQHTYTDRFQGWLHNGELLPEDENGDSIIHMDKNTEVTAKWLHLFVVAIQRGQPDYNIYLYISPTLEGTIINVPSYTFEDTDEYMFTGKWMCNGEPFDEPIVLDAELNISGVWVKACYLTFDKANGEEPERRKVGEGTVITMAELDEMLAPGSTYTDAETGTEYALKGWRIGDGMISGDITVTGDATITAVWEINEITEP